jgi:hypothetical protein
MRAGDVVWTVRRTFAFNSTGVNGRSHLLEAETAMLYLRTGDDGFIHVLHPGLGVIRIGRRRITGANDAGPG